MSLDDNNLTKHLEKCKGMGMIREIISINPKIAAKPDCVKISSSLPLYPGIHIHRTPHSKKLEVR